MIELIDYCLKNDGYWKVLVDDGTVERDWRACSITDVPKEYLLKEYEFLVNELSEKEVELANVKETYNLKEFEIVFKSTDIDFKALYGSTSEKVRKQHAKEVLSELDKVKSGLELSIEFIKNYIVLIREVLKLK